MIAWTDLTPAQRIVMRAAYKFGSVERGLYTEEGSRKQHSGAIKHLIIKGLLTDAGELTSAGSLIIPAKDRVELRPINAHMANVTNPAQAWSLKIKMLRTGDALIVNSIGVRDFRICRCATKSYQPAYVIRCQGIEFFKEFIFDEHEARRELIKWLMEHDWIAEEALYQRDDPVALTLSGVPTCEQLELPDLNALEIVTPGDKPRDRSRKAVKKPEFIQMRLIA